MINPFERLWKDKMEVTGWEEYTENNITKHKEMPKASVRCHYSQGSLTEIEKGEVPTLNSSHKLFCPVGVAKEGDEVIVIQSDGKAVKLTIGEGFPYRGGMQHIVKRSDTV